MNTMEITEMKITDQRRKIMNNDYYYTKGNNGTVYRYRIEQDTDPINPREDYDNACKLYLWWNGYNLGDDKGKDMPGDILNDLIEKYRRRPIL